MLFMSKKIFGSFPFIDFTSIENGSISQGHILSEISPENYYTYKFTIKLNIANNLSVFFLNFISLQTHHTVEYRPTTNVTKRCWSTLPNWWQFAASYAWISTTYITFSAYTTLLAIFTVKVSTFKTVEKKKTLKIK